MHDKIVFFQFFSVLSCFCFDLQRKAPKSTKMTAMMRAATGAREGAVAVEGVSATAGVACLR